MAALGSEFEQRFSEVLTSRAVAAPHRAVGGVRSAPEPTSGGGRSVPALRSSTRPEPGHGAVTPYAVRTRATA
jgi:hypothetical protein